MDLTRSTLKIFGSKAASAVISFAGITFFARELGASQLGSFFLFQALLGILAIPADFGIRGAVEKRVSEGEDADAVLTTAVLLKLFPLILIVMGIVLFQKVINQYVGASVALFLALALVLREFAQLGMFVLRGELRVGETALLQFARQIVWVSVGAAFVLSDGGVDGLIVGLLAGSGVLLVWVAYKISIGIAAPTAMHARSLFNYSKYNFISSIGGYFYSWMDVAIIGLFLTQADVGAYEIAWRVTAAVMLFSQSIATTLFPQISEWSATNAIDQIEGIIPRAITPSLFLLIPIFFGTLLFSKEILGVIFGTDYAIAWLVLIVLMLDVVFQGAQVIIGRSLQAIDQPNLAARASVISVIVNLSLNILLISQFGIIGAAVATFIASIANDSLHYFYLSKFISIRLPLQELSWCVTGSIVMALLLLVPKLMFEINTLIEIIVIVSLGGVVYLLFVFSSRSFRLRALSQLRLLLG